MAKAVEATTDEVNFSVKAKAFREAFQIVSLTLDKRRDSEGTSLYLEAVTKSGPSLLLFTTNHQQMTLIKIPAVVEKTGSVVLEPNLLVRILAGLNEDDDISFRRKAGTARVQMKAGQSRVGFTIGKDGIFPQLVRSLPYTKKENLRIEAFKMREVVDRASTFFYKGDDNYALKNLLIETKDNCLESYATNRIAVAHAGINGLQLPEGQTFSVEIPGAAIATLRRILARVKDTETEKLMLRLMVGETDGKPSSICIRTADMFYVSGLTASGFPASIKEASAAVKASSEVSVSREGLMAVLGRAAAFCAVSKCVRVTASETGIRVEASNQGVGFSDANQFEEDIALSESFTGNEQIHISIDSLMNALNSAKEEVVKITFAQQKSVVLVTSGNDQAGRSSYLLSTMRAAVAA